MIKLGKDVRLAKPEDIPYLFDRVKNNLLDGTHELLASAVIFELVPRAGVFWVTGLRIGQQAAGHIHIWDNSWRGKASELRPVFETLMCMYQLRRLSAYIPSTNTLACRFAERVGFVMEGVLRSAGSMKGVPVDLVAYSLLKEDFNGR
jgi:RimJ/RimL family protein N-acetyltransferase